MKFSQRRLGDAAEINTGAVHAWRDRIRLLFWIGGALILINIIAWAVVEIGVRHISIETEARWFGSTEAQTEVPPSLGTFKHVLDRLTQHEDVPTFPYQIEIMETSEPNAFAALGGAIYVTSGLVDALENDEILIAFLLGHELGHFKNRDHLKGAGRAVLLSVFMLPFSGQGLDLASSFTQMALLNSYSRTQEEAADSFGLKLVYDCYGETDGAIQLMRTLDTEQIPTWAYMFTTHPSFVARIRNMEAEIEKVRH